MAKFVAAAIQIDSRNDKNENIQKIEHYIALAALRGARLIGMPEMVSFIGDEDEEIANAEPIPGPTINQFADIARQFNIWLHCGSIFESIEGSSKLFNTSVLLSPSGEIAAKYRKIHLFDAEIKNGPSFRESNTKQAGTEIVVAETELCTIGLSICYDMRFPELYRSMMERCAQVIFVAAEYTLITGKDHWDPLLRARAIENQVYIIAPGQIGVKPGFQAYGRSAIVDPWGNVVARMPDREGFILAEIDIDYLKSVRKQLPCLYNRRPDLYEWIR